MIKFPRNSVPSLLSILGLFFHFLFFRLLLVSFGFSFLTDFEFGLMGSGLVVLVGYNRVRYIWGRVSNFHQSEARKDCFLASDWSKFETLPRKYRTLELHETFAWFYWHWVCYQAILVLLKPHL